MNDAVVLFHPVGSKLEIWVDSLWGRRIKKRKMIATVHKITIRGRKDPRTYITKQEEHYIQYYVTVMFRGQQHEFDLLNKNFIRRVE